MKKFFPLLAICFLVACTPDHLTILHTNDTHSQIEPKSNDQGGYARRMGLIKQEILIGDKSLRVATQTKHANFQTRTT